jgi:hypothetical protein
MISLKGSDSCVAVSLTVILDIVYHLDHLLETSQHFGNLFCFNHEGKVKARGATLMGPLDEDVLDTTKTKQMKQ